jgi:hypothetical protein
MSKKTFQDEPKQHKLFSIRMDYDEWKKYHQTAKKAGKKTLANLIRELLESYIRNPNILNPISNTNQEVDSKELTDKLGKVIKLLIRREQRDIQADEDRQILQKLSVADLKQQGMSFKDINAILEGLDQSGEAIFIE